jgi:hypothetical protein
MFYGPKIGAKTYFKTKALPRLCIYKTTGTWFYDPTILQNYYFINLGQWFSNTLEKNLVEEMFMSPTVFESIYKSFLPIIEILSNFTMT